MGCFYETCSITNLPIPEGSEVVLLRYPGESYSLDNLIYNVEDVHITVGPIDAYGKVEPQSVTPSPSEFVSSEEYFSFFYKPAWDDVVMFMKEAYPKSFLPAGDAELRELTMAVADKLLPFLEQAALKDPDLAYEVNELKGRLYKTRSQLHKELSAVRKFLFLGRRTATEINRKVQGSQMLQFDVHQKFVELNSKYLKEIQTSFENE